MRRRPTGLFESGEDSEGTRIRCPLPVARTRYPPPASRFPLPVSRFPFPVSRFPQVSDSAASCGSAQVNDDRTGRPGVKGSVCPTSENFAYGRLRGRLRSMRIE